MRVTCRVSCRPLREKVLRTPKERAALLKTLRSMRVKAGLSQAQVAAALRVPQSLVSKYESGERRLDFLELRAVCSALGTTLRDFNRLFEQNLAAAQRR
jgi:transcriptional regulator with XRE-family HTH domain